MIGEESRNMLKQKEIILAHEELKTSTLPAEAEVVPKLARWPSWLGRVEARREIAGTARLVKWKPSFAWPQAASMVKHLSDEKPFMLIWTQKNIDLMWCDDVKKTIYDIQEWKCNTTRNIFRQFTAVSKSPSLKASSGDFGKKGWPLHGESATGIEITPSSKSAFVKSQAETFLRQMYLFDWNLRHSSRPSELMSMQPTRTASSFPSLTWISLRLDLIGRTHSFLRAPMVIRWRQSTNLEIKKVIKKTTWKQRFLPTPLCPMILWKSGEVAGADVRW